MSDWRRRYRLAACCMLIAAASANARPATPSWEQLDARQQQVLAPLSGEWNRFSPAHKQQLLALVPRYDSLSAGEKHNVTARLRQWADLSEEQRAEARRHWQLLQSMPAGQRQQLLTRLKLRRQALYPTPTGGHE